MENKIKELIEKMCWRNYGQTFTTLCEGVKNWDSELLLLFKEMYQKGFNDCRYSVRNDETDMIKYAKHIHIAVTGKEIDCCKKCGHDIRHPIHLRQIENICS
mgnify:CR=1 FL=1